MSQSIHSQKTVIHFVVSLHFVSMSHNSALVSSSVLVVEPITATIVCGSCECGLGSVSAAVKHIRKHHPEYVAALEDITASIGAAQAFALSEGHPMRETYLSAPAAEGPRHALQPLRYLAVTNGFQCVWCEKCYKVLRNVREHGNRVHGGRGDELYKAMCQAGMIKVQTILTGTKTRYFRVKDVPLPARDVGTESGGAGTRITTEVRTTRAVPGTGSTVGPAGSSSAGNGDGVNPVPGIVTVQAASCDSGRGLELLAAAGSTLGSTVQPGPNVRSNDVEGSIGSFAQETLGAGNTNRQSSGSVSGSSQLREVGGMLNAIFHNRVFQESVGVVKERELTSDFLAASELDVVLQDAEISLVNAARMALPVDRNEPLELAMLEDTKRYFECFAEVRRLIAPSLIRRLTVKHDEKLGIITQRTRVKYAGELSRYLAYTARRCKSECVVPEAVKTAMLVYQGIAESGSWSSRCEALQGLLESVLLQRQSMSAPTCNLHIRLYVSCAAVQCKFDRNGDALDGARFGEAWELSGTLASLQFSASMVGVVKVSLLHPQIHRAFLEGNIGVSSVDAASAVDDRTDEEDTVVETVSNCLDVKQNTSVSIVRTVLNHCMTSWKAHRNDGDFLPCTQHPNCGFINGLELSMTSLSKVVASVQTSLERSLSVDLLLGFQTPSSFKATLSSLTEHMSCPDNGFGFLTHAPNRAKLLPVAQSFVEHLCTNDRARSSLEALKEHPPGDVIEFQTLKLSKSKVKKWLVYCRLFQEKMAPLLHVCCGSPGRCTEMAALNLLNTEVSRRNVFVSEGKVMLLYRYSKQRGLCGSDKYMARFADSRSSKILLTYLAIVRPVETVMLQLMDYTTISGGRHMTALFSHEGKRFTGSRLTTVFQTMFAEEHVIINVSMYRQWASGMVRILTGDEEDNRDMIAAEMEKVAHTQYGHTADMADRMYGRGSEDVVELGFRALQQYRAWCTLWHRHLKLVNEVEQPHANESQSTSQVVSGSHCSKYATGMNSVPMNSPTYLGKVISDNVERVLKRQFSELGSFSTGGGSSDQQTPLGPKRARGNAGMDGSAKCSQDNDLYNSPTASVAPLRRTEVGRTLTPRLSLGLPPGCMKEVSSVRMVEPLPRNIDEDCAILLKALRRMFGNPSATFKSQMQSDVVATIRSCESNAVVVMPTAAGKSICFLLPCFMDSPGNVSIIVVPLVALKQELMKRCEAFHIPAVMWSPTNSASELRNPTGRVYLISAEHLEMSSFSKFVRELNGKKSLRRIIVDEAHLSVLWSDFRPCLQRMQYTLQSLKCQVPTYLFSATIPPRDTANVLMAHGVSNAFVFRMPSVRKNIGISVRYCRAVPVDLVRKQMQKAAIEGIVDVCRSEEAVRGARILVYAQRIDDLVRLRAQFSVYMTTEQLDMIEVFIYTGRMAKVKREETHQQWCATLPGGRVRIMLCTNAFGTGIDSERVVSVIHFGGSNSLADYAQEIGRAGRTGNAVQVLLVYSDNFASRMMSTMLGSNTPHHACTTGMEDVPMTSVARTSQFSEFRNWAESEQVCRKNALYTVLDGIPVGLCMNDPESINCDVCNLRKLGGTTTTQRQGFDLDDILPTANKVGNTNLNEQEVSPPTARVLVFGQNSADVAGGQRVSTCVQGTANVDSNLYEHSRRDIFTQAGDNSGEEEVDELPLLHVLANNPEVLVRGMREIVAQLGRSCPHCLVRKNILVEHERCPIKIFCGICCSGQHRRRQCPCRRNLQGKCVRCGMASICGVNLHESETFGKPSCPYKICQDICIILYHIGYEKDVLLLPLMNVEKRQKLLVDVRLRDGASMVKEFMDWLLQSKEHIQHTVHIFLGWARRSELVIDPKGLWITA